MTVTVGAGVVARRGVPIDGSAPMTGALKLPDGTASAPSVTNTGDTDNGLYFPGTNEVGIATAGTQRMHFGSAGAVYINDSANANMAVGLTINGGPNDNQHFAIKNSDVAHGLTSAGQSAAETDDFFTIQKGSATGGGAHVQVMAENDGLVSPLRFNVYGGTANANKTTSAAGKFDIYTSDHDGANALADEEADSNLFSIRCRRGGVDGARFLVDEDGDFLYDGVDGGAFDAHDDVMLVEAFDQIRAPSTTIKDAFADWAVNEVGEQKLVELGILGDTIANGGLVNGAQLQRLHNGAIRQLARENRALAAQLAAVTERLTLTGPSGQEH